MKDSTLNSFLKVLLITLTTFHICDAAEFTNRTKILANTVTINQAAGQLDPTNAGPVIFRVVFDEEVTGFTETDIDFTGSTASGTLAASVISVTPGLVYDVEVSGMTGDGIVIASVVAGAATLVSDGATTTAASTSTDNQVTYDTTNPGLTLSSITLPTITGFTLNVRYDEASTVYYIVNTSAVPPSVATIKAANNFSVAANTSTPEPITGLTSETQYYAHFFAEDAAGNQSTVDTESTYTLSIEPSTQPATLTATAVSTSQINLSFTDPATITNASGFIILRRQDGVNPTTTGVVDGTAPGSLSLPAGTTLVSTEIAGTTTFNNTSLSAGTQYNYIIIPFNFDGTNNETYNYKTDGTISNANDFTFSLEPSTHTTFFESLATSATQITLNFNSITTASIANATGYIILRRQDGTNPTNTGIIDGVAPGSLTLPAGTTLVTTINSTATNTFNNTGLTTGTQYNYAIIPFNWNNSNAGTYNYFTDPTIPTDFSTPASGPNIVTLNPADNSIASSLSLANAVITFNVAVAKISGGAANTTRTARLYQVGNATPISEIDKDNFTGYGTTTITIPFAATLIPNNDYYIQIGNNAIKISPNSTTWGGINDNTTWNFSAAATVITPANTVNVCYDGDFQTLSNIVIRESSSSDFAVGNGQTYSIVLPNGFVFNPGVGSVSVTGNNISNGSVISYLSGNTIARFSYDINGTSGAVDQITLTGLQVKYIGSTNSSGNIVRIGGSAIQTGNGDADNKNHGTLSANASNGSVPDYTVAEIPGDLTVSPTETRFSVSSPKIKLVGNPSGGIFSGNGATLSNTNGWIFDIPSVGVGTYPITYTVREAGGQQCLTSFTKNLEVYSGVIQNLNNSYCINANAATGLTVSQAQIDSRWGTAYELYDFIYFLPGFGYTPITPVNTTFDPGSSNYSTSINTYNGVYIYYRYTDKATRTQIYYGDWQFVRIIPLPTISYTISKTVFCVDDAPVSLIGSPVPQFPVSDNFTGPGVSSPSSNNWIFTPSSVPNANSSPQTIEVFYNYRDPNTTCTNSISKSITVSPRPTAVPNASISPGVSIEVCQNGTPGNFNATAVNGTTYNWYYGNPPVAYLYSANSFSPGPYTDTSVPGTTDFSVTRTTNGCESPIKALSVIVNPTPSSPGSSFDRPYCVGDIIPNSDFTVTGSSIKWVNAFTNQTLTIANPNSPTIQELGITNASAGKYSYIVSQAVAGCESNPINVTSVVYDLPQVFITPQADLQKICKTGEVINVFGSPANGDWSGTASSALINTNKPAGSTQLNPAALNTNPGTYTLRYDYTDGNNCSNFKIENLQVLPTINPSVNVGTACDKLPVEFTNNSQVDPAGATTIIGTSWNFGDGSSLAVGSGAVPPGSNGGRTNGTYFSPNHIFSNVGTFQFSYTMYTSDGCIVAVPSQPVNVRANPIVNFSWANVCSGTSTVFNANTNNNPAIPDSEMNYTWEFSKTNQLIEGTPIYNGNRSLASLTYSNTGRDSVKVVGTSIYNCKDSIQKPVFIVPTYAAITEDNAYSQDFNAGADGWLIGGIKSSWAWGQPSGQVITRDSSATGQGSAWVTNLNGFYNSNEKSWVLSRCFDFTQSQKPVISFDIWADTPGGIDGAVLQYNVTGNIEDDNNWVVVGTINSGINWYEQQGIASKPGNQTQFDLGWSGNKDDGRYKSWKHAVFKLDELIGQSSVVFRIAFASNNSSTREGFAFDNVFIGERTRTVLIESFTNSSSTANSKTHNDFYKQFASTSNEVVKLQFHSSFPGLDPINALNKPMNDSRTAFYGITSSPTLRIDGKFKSGAASGWANNLYDNQILQPSPIRITIDPPQKVDGVVKINATITNITSVPLTLNGANAFVGIVEKSISDSPWMGSNGDTEFIWVARQLLPSPSGILLNTVTILPNESYQLEEVTWSNNNLIKPGINNSAIVVFIQAIEAGAQYSHQAKLYVDPTSLPEPDIITDTEDPTYASKISLYPNPANQELQVVLPAPVAKPTLVNMIDAFGKVAHQLMFNTGEQQKTIRTAELAAGIYVVQIGTPNDGVAYRKVIITH